MKEVRNILICGEVPSHRFSQDSMMLQLLSMINFL